MRYAILLATLFVVTVVPCDGASPTGWSATVLPMGQYRTRVKSMPIQQRPGRLLHVYGNTIRMFDQYGYGTPIRPLRQILIGTPDLRGDVFGIR